MKALVLLSLLLLSAGTARAEVGMDSKNAYYFGLVYGAAMILCAPVNMGELKKDIAQETMDYLVERLSSSPKSKDVSDSIQKAYEVVKQEDTCKGVY